ncbi:MAG TPA: GtrA family protein [Casimicrobiaceae bacterium]|nr:GtrA family protein [Casimicrobiaceae bacterium]
MNGLRPLSPGVRQFTRFVVVGCINVAVSFAGFMLFYRVFPLATLVLTALGSAGMEVAASVVRLGVRSIDAAVANTLGAAAGMVNSFLLNKYWTFEAAGLTRLQVRRFLILNILVIGGSSVVVFVCMDLLGAPYLPSWIVATGLAMIANFVGNKYWTFAGASKLQATPRASADGRA